jgi:outer membrane protein OmpA-like peptidoglycan-associated protein
MSGFQKGFFLMLGVLLCQNIFGQKEGPSPMSCMNAQEVVFPLSLNDFSDSQILQEEKKLNALYYLYEDRYTFWYKFIAVEAVEISFSVSPTNRDDRYRAIVFDYGGSDFCDKLVNQDLQTMSAKRTPIFGDDGQVLYKNSIEAAKGDTFFISVLSLSPDDCGHFLYMESGGEKLSLHAIHRPCYNFSMLEQPDFSTAKEVAEDVFLQLDLGNSVAPPDTAEQPPAPTGFAALETVEVQSEEADFISVGDRLILNQVFFYNNTFAFKPGAEEELNQLVSFLNMNPTVEIEVQGHTANNTPDIRPDPNFKGQGKEWNFKGSAFKLSEKRAEAVVTFLIENGIEKKRLVAKGYGDTQKRIPNATSFEEFEKNMRVEAVVTKQ